MKNKPKIFFFTIKSVVSIITHHVQERTEQLVHMWETVVDGRKTRYAWGKWPRIAQHVQERIKFKMIACEK